MLAYSNALEGLKSVQNVLQRLTTDPSVADEPDLGRADFQVRSDLAIRRHQTLVNCAFSFCWNAWFDSPPITDSEPEATAVAEPTEVGSVERGPASPTTQTLLAQGITSSPRLACP